MSVLDPTDTAHAGFGPAGRPADERPRVLHTRRGLRKYLPRTLFGRTLMIIVTPLVMVQAIASFVFYDHYWDLLAKRLSWGVAGEVAMMIDNLEGAATAAERSELIRDMATHTDLRVFYEPFQTLEVRPERFGYATLVRRLSQALDGRIQRPFVIDPAVSPNMLEVQFALTDARMRVIVPLRRLFTGTNHVVILWLAGSSLVLFTVAILFMRNQIRPIRRLALAADKFGRGDEVVPFKPEGATEVRQAAHAFLLMRDRIQRQISQRTEMLAGVSHDLRTPLTRMKLQLAFMGDSSETEELRRDIVEMERMIEDYLAFARGEGTESPVDLDVGHLIEELSAKARREGVEVEVALAGSLRLSGRREALKRAVGNLVGNAGRYGTAVWLAARRIDRAIEIVVDDDGPGLAPHLQDEVFKPFFRLEASRNPETGGTGLGLTIARDIARRHGGDIVLTGSPKGGLRAVMTLPT